MRPKCGQGFDVGLHQVDDFLISHSEVLRSHWVEPKKKRAFSRYVQALVKEESSELAMEALARLDAELPVEERMTIETMKETTKRRYEEEEKKDNNLFSRSSYVLPS